MQRLLETNMEHTCGYGLDDYSLRAADVIREKCGQPGAAVHIMVGGTSANSIAIAAFLRPYEAAICAPTGHINVHETGAVGGDGAQGAPLCGEGRQGDAGGRGGRLRAAHGRAYGRAAAALHQPADGNRHRLPSGRAEGAAQGLRRARADPFCGRRAAGERADQRGM